MADYDAIVVGSGAGGMAAALKVARADHSVLVLEAAPAFGGCMNPMQKAGYSFHIGVHYLGQLAEGDRFWRALDEIGLADRVQLIELNPDAIDRYVFPDFELRLCKGKERCK
jgi:phytoene dehydrogenase-like protein